MSPILPLAQVALKSEDIARVFHEAYERLAPDYAWDTNDSTRVPFDELPSENRELMIHTVSEVMVTWMAERGSLIRYAEEGWALAASRDAEIAALKKERMEILIGTSDAIRMVGNHYIGELPELPESVQEIRDQPDNVPKWVWPDGFEAEVLADVREDGTPIVLLFAKCLYDLTDETVELPGMQLRPKRGSLIESRVHMEMEAPVALRIARALVEATSTRESDE